MKIFYFNEKIKKKKPIKESREGVQKDLLKEKQKTETLLRAKNVSKTIRASNLNTKEKKKMTLFDFRLSFITFIVVIMIIIIKRKFL